MCHERHGLDALTPPLSHKTRTRCAQTRCCVHVLPGHGRGAGGSVEPGDPACVRRHILVEGQTLFSIQARTASSFARLLGAAVLAATISVGGSGSALARDVTFASPQAALEQGVNAYRGGYLEIALPALRYAARHDEFLARFLLATILADNNNAFTDHPEAYKLFRDIAALSSRVDPDDDPRAPYVAHALVATSGYLRRGIPEARVGVDAARAAQLLHTAASFFGNHNAQLELAKMLLTGEGGRKDEKLALHFLSTLSRAGHPNALAFLADLRWRGRHVDKDEVLALALATAAVKRAAPTDRIWIDETYQAIYCSIDAGVRQRAEPQVNRWNRAFGAVMTGILNRQRHASDMDELAPTRTCANGEPVPLLDEVRRQRSHRAGTLPGEPSTGPRVAVPTPPAAPLLDVDAKRQSR